MSGEVGRHGTRLSTIIALRPRISNSIPDLTDGMPRHPPVVVGAKLKFR